MTAEIVIMNKEAVAIAADSAVSLITGLSVQPQKIFTSANKIFELPEHHTACIMIYNNASFMGIPWETIINVFREKLGSTQRDTLKEYAEDFIDLLARDKELIPKGIEEKFFVATIFNYFLFIRYLVQQRATTVVQEKGNVSEEDVKGIITSLVAEIHGKLSTAPDLPQIKKGQIKDLAKTFDEEMNTAIREIFEKLPIDDATAGRLKEIVLWFFSKDAGPATPMQEAFSGVVIVGFGKKEIFPSLVSLSFEGRIGDILKFKIEGNSQITFENGAMVIPFAQREMVDIFISGMDPHFEQALLSGIASAFTAYTDAIVDAIEKIDEQEKNALKVQFQPKIQEVVAQLSNELDNFRLSNFVPIVNVVASLPKSELAAMAESLVNITSLKRKVSMQAETVGGPVDVAMISKSDGFVWIKKKQYYTSELNPPLLVHEGRRSVHVAKGE